MALPQQVTPDLGYRDQSAVGASIMPSHPRRWSVPSDPAGWKGNNGSLVPEEGPRVELELCHLVSLLSDTNRR